jgi:MFS family permease
MGAYLADAIGRKWTFMISAIATIIMVLVCLYVLVGNTGLLLLGIPLNAAILMKFAPMGPFMTELYPTNIRGTGQGFCYNAGRAIGSVFMTAIGFATAVMPLGHGDCPVLDFGPWANDRHALAATGDARPRHHEP